jgi:predicted metal-dependent enzyme (double-stranded beta helix superfamily)
MNQIATWIRERVPADQDLDREGLVRLAREIGLESSLWANFERHDESERFYHQLYRDPNVDVWLICWLPGQGTGYHDHDRSDGAVYVCRGARGGWTFRVRGGRHSRCSPCRRRARDVGSRVLARALADGPL